MPKAYNSTFHTVQLWPTLCHFRWIVSIFEGQDSLTRHLNSWYSALWLGIGSPKYWLNKWMIIVVTIPGTGYMLDILASSHFSTNVILSGIIQISCQDKMWSFPYLWTYIFGLAQSNSLLVLAYLKLGLRSLGWCNRWEAHMHMYTHTHTHAR